MEWKIGEIRQVNDEWYQCLESDNCRCDYCDLDGVIDCCKIACAYGERIDNKEVYFKKLEKVGEPIVYMNRTFQRLKSFENYQCRYCYFRTQVCNPQLCGEKLFLVEIKKAEKDMKEYIKKDIKEDIKEDMEEKKLKLKPFDIQKAKEGKPVCTRDGRSVRILCFDAKRRDEKNIIALVPSKGYPGFEDLIAYPDNGIYYGEHENDGNLMMMPEKKEGWIVINKEAVYDKETAEKIAKETTVDVIRIQKIEWEE